MIIRILIILAITWLINGCKNCNQCRDTPPNTGILKIDLSYDSCMLTVYQSPKIGGKVIRKGRFKGRDFDTTLPAGPSYSAKAVYQLADKKVIGIDGNQSIDESKKEDRCDSPCYKIDEAKLKL